MEKKKEQKENRFTYSSNDGLSILSEKEILDSIGDNKEVKKSEEIHERFTDPPFISNLKKSEDNQLKGGKADKLTIEDLANKHKVDLNKIKDQVKQGLRVEMEHTDSPKKALEIVLDHLFESASYYTKLKEMEQTFKKDE